MHPKDNNPPPRAPMEEEEDTNPSNVARNSKKKESDSFALDVVVEDSSSAVRVTGAEVLSERADTEAAVEAAQDPRLGETLVGRYRLDKLVGKGGMGRVYRATQFPLNRPVAVKILNPEFQKKDPQFVRRFFLEAASAARLTHPNTITVFDYGEAESGELFIAMEYLKGRPLSKVLTVEGPFGAERVLHIAMQICRALREAHSKGIIHRDLKPGNILLLEEGDDADFVKVLDFGLVKLFTPVDLGRSGSAVEPLTPGPIQEGDLTKAGMFLGSPKYMSPEQIQAIPLDPRTDIYSLGVLMYQMSSGKPPFTGATSVEVIYKHVNHPVPPISDAGVIVAPELEAVILKCLAKKREDRFESMAELLVRLKDVRRLITGVSTASETGLGLRMRGPDVSVSQPGAADDISLSHSQSQSSSRPQTHRRVRATEVPAEAAFVDQALHEDANPTNSFMRQARLVQGGGMGLAKLAPMLAGSALVLVLGVLAYVLARPTPGAAPPPHAEEVTDTKARVRFNSMPPGAEVFQHGVSLGHTPLTVNLPRAQPGEPPEQFVLKLEGHHDEVHEASLDSTSVDISVRMRPRAKDDQGSEDYKENPY